MATNNTPKTARLIFGIFMIIIYVGMGILLLVNFFDWESGSWEWLRWTGGVLLSYTVSGGPTDNLPESTQVSDLTTATADISFSRNEANNRL